MGQEEYGPYTKDEPRKFNLRKFVRYVVLITLILAVLEVVAIYFVVDKKNSQNIAQVVHDTISNLPKVNPITTDSLVARKSFSDSAAISSYVNARVDTSVNRPSTVADSASIVLTEQKPAVKNLTQSDMLAISTRIINTNLKRNNKSHCIQIRKTSSSNVANAFKLAEYLKKQGYIINGRLIVNSHQKGVSIESAADCTTVTIGSM